MNQTKKNGLFKQRHLVALGFIGWSAAMIGVGSMTNIADTFIPSAQATHHEETVTLIRLDKERLAGMNLGDYAPYEPETGSDLIARGHEYYYSKDRNFGLGVWESKPGSIEYKELEYDELMYVLDGGLVMTSADGVTNKFGPGEGCVLPKGWSGTWKVPAGGWRKIWVAYTGGAKG